MSDQWKQAVFLQSPPEPRLRVEFVELADRIHHRILLTDSLGSFQPVLESLEGLPEDLFPPSPAFQQIHKSRIESDGRSGEAIMLIGSTKSCHWSACISFDQPALSATSEVLSFDIACRCRGSFDRLGSAYRIVNTHAAQLQRTETSVTLRFEGHLGRVRLSLASVDDETPVACELALIADSIHVKYVSKDVAERGTHRWRYTIELVH